MKCTPDTGCRIMHAHVLNTVQSTVSFRIGPTSDTTSGRPQNTTHGADGSRQHKEIRNWTRGYGF